VTGIDSSRRGSLASCVLSVTLADECARLVSQRVANHCTAGPSCRCDNSSQFLPRLGPPEGAFFLQGPSNFVIPVAVSAAKSAKLRLAHELSIFLPPSQLKIGLDHEEQRGHEY
jgi:hypothetical protein